MKYLLATNVAEQPAAARAVICDFIYDLNVWNHSDEPVDLRFYLDDVLLRQVALQPFGAPSIIELNAKLGESRKLLVELGPRQATQIEVVVLGRDFRSRKLRVSDLETNAR